MAAMRQPVDTMLERVGLQDHPGVRTCTADVSQRDENEQIFRTIGWPAQLNRAAWL